jgi:hypothetical protein
MKYCEKCKVKIDMDLIKCPLCSAVLIGSNGASDTEDEALKQTVEVSVPEATAEGDVPEAAAEGDVSEAVVEGEVPEAVAEDELPEAAEEDDVPEAAEGKSLEAAAEAEPDGNSGETGSAPTARNSKYPVSAVETANKYNFVLRLFLFISVVIASTCLLINILTFSGILWSAYVAGTLLYVWITVGYPIFTKRKIGQIIVLNTIATAIYVYSLELATKTKGWGLTYVTPFLFIASTLFITFVILLKRLKWREYTVYQTIMVIMGFLPIIFCAFGLVTAIWPSVFSAFYSFLTVIGMFIFGDKKYKDELIKRFHL